MEDVAVWRFLLCAAFCCLTVALPFLSPMRVMGDEFAEIEPTQPSELLTFKYAPGEGLLVRGPKEYWSIRLSLETRLDIPFQAGKESAGRIDNGEPFDRRTRPFVNICVVDCFYELEWEFDVNENRFVDSSRSTKRLFSLTFQRSMNYFHLEKISPLLPTFYGGFGYTFEINPYRRGDFTSSAQLEYDLLSRNNGFDEGRFVNAVGVSWPYIPLQILGIPGKAKFNFASGRIGIGGIVLAGSDKDRAVGNLEGELRQFNIFNDYALLGQIEPFSQIKNKWIQGFGFSVGAWFCRIRLDPKVEEACNSLRILDHANSGRQVLFGTSRPNPGLAYFITPGVQWEIGPYRLRAIGGFQRYSRGDVDRFFLRPFSTRGNNFLIANELFLWSPNGWFSGSAAIPGSILFGTHFERTDVDCNVGGKTLGLGPSGCTGAGFNRNTILLREWDLWYFIMERMSVAVSFLWYDATNLSRATRRNLDLDLRSVFSSPGGNWLDVNLAWRWRF
jgi:hypothetical protein